MRSSRSCAPKRWRPPRRCGRPTSGSCRASKLNELLQAGAIDLVAYARAVEEANDRALRSSQAWTDGATRFLKDYVAESNDAASATERAFATAFSGAEDAVV